MKRTFNRVGNVRMPHSDHISRKEKTDVGVEKDLNASYKELDRRVAKTCDVKNLDRVNDLESISLVLDIVDWVEFIRDQKLDTLNKILSVISNIKTSDELSGMYRKLKLKEIKERLRKNYFGE